jgi:hypothetical protein
MPSPVFSTKIRNGTSPDGSGNIDIVGSPWETAAKNCTGSEYPRSDNSTVITRSAGKTIHVTQTAADMITAHKANQKHLEHGLGIDAFICYGFGRE